VNNELKQLWYNKYPHHTVLDILTIIKQDRWSVEDIFSQITELYDDGQIGLALNSTPCIYPIMRIVDDSPEQFNHIINKTSERKHLNRLIWYVYRAGIKKRELEDLYWIMCELKKYTKGRVRMTWTYLSRHKKFFDVDRGENI